MRSSRLRYLASAMAAAALINFFFHWLIGELHFAPMARVAVDGKGGIGDDTVFNAFCIVAVTWWLVSFAAQREARAGRVRGGGNKFFAWLGRHRILAAIVVGLFSATAVAIPCLIALKHSGVLGMAGTRYAWCKALFAAAVAAASSGLAAMSGILAEADADWHPEVDAGWAFDHIDKGALAVTSREHGCSGTPTWQLLVHGRLDPDHVRQALANTVTRYPLLATRVVALDGVPAHASRYQYATDPDFSIDAIFQDIDLRGEAERLASVEEEHLNRHTDLFCDPPVTLSLLHLDEQRSRLVFRQHHAIADGRAFIELLVDFTKFLEAARHGRLLADPAPVARRGELEALQLSPWRRRWWTVAGVFVLLRSRFTPIVRLLQNQGNDYRGANGTVHWSVGEETLAAWNAARTRLGVSLNSLLTAALFIAHQRRQRTHGRKLGRATASLVMETRPRDGEFRSFANHMAVLEVAADLGRAEDLTAMARQIQAQVERQRRRNTPIQRLLAERFAVLKLALSELQPMVFDSRRPSHNIDFSNLIPLEFPTLSGEGFLVEEVRITTPVTPRTGILTTVIRYHGRITFNFNYKASAVSREETEALLREFQAVLGDAI